MSKRNWVLVGIATVALLFGLGYFFSGHQTPLGQPQLLAITPQSFPGSRRNSIVLRRRNAWCS